MYMVITWNELRDARERMGLTQEELAEKLNVSTRTITNWEKSGVARKAEYKVERFFGDELARSTGMDRIDEELAYQDRVSGMSLDERAEHEGLTTFAHVLKEASDVELLEEVLRRARLRGLVAVSKETELPRQTQREAQQMLRGKRDRLTMDDTIPNIADRRSNVSTVEDHEGLEQEKAAAFDAKKIKRRKDDGEFF